MEKIQPVITGELTCTDRFGRPMTPRLIRFEPDGGAVALCYHYLYGNHTSPVLRSNGERLSMPGFAGLLCDYDQDKGTIEGFRNEGED